ncbi:MAG: betaine/proline/choline family ABC transporter ATP-binding protein [Chloroflexota bacterium]
MAHVGSTTNSTTNSTTEHKISVQSLWKVYGSNPEQFFAQNQSPAQDTNALVETMRSAEHIPAVANISFDIAEGEKFVIMGLSGSGKSTVIRCITRLVEPTRGQILMDGEDILTVNQRRLVDLRRHKMGMVFQNFGLLPHLTVLENVAFPLKIQNISHKSRVDKAKEMIELVGLGGRENAYPRQLSGGQQQRVGIARSLAVEPDIWLLDEPFSALDPLIRRQMQDEFLRLQAQLQKTIVFITHDFMEAIRLADRICILHAGQIAQIGTPEEIILNPADDYVAEFTSEVPVSHVLKVEAVMSPLTATPGDSMPTIAQDKTVEEAVQLFEDGTQQLFVSDGAKIVGQLTPYDLVLAMSKRSQG